MDESEWLRGFEPRLMLSLLRRAGRGYISYRKLRLLLVAHGRQDPNPLDPGNRRAFEVAERFADGLATREELLAAGNDAYGGYPSDMQTEAEICAPKVTRLNIVRATDEWAQPAGLGAERLTIRARLIQEVFGNPFRPIFVDFDALVRRNNPLRLLAQKIYEDRSFDMLPRLGEALLAAGCEDEDVLAHCRSAQQHVRGCWVLDCLLGKARMFRTFPLYRCTLLRPPEPDSSLSPAEAITRVQRVFPHVEINREVGGFRLDHRMRYLAERGAPPAVFELERQWREPTIQLTVTGAAGGTPILDLSVTPARVRVYHRRRSHWYVYRCAQCLGYTRESAGPDFWDERTSPEEWKYECAKRGL
jgi:hypothetical protein